MQSLLKKYLRITSEQGTFLIPRIKKRIISQPIREALATPRGWLCAPNSRFCLFFFRDPKLGLVAPTVFTQRWYCTEEGITTKLKNADLWTMNLLMKLEMSFYLMIGS